MKNKSKDFQNPYLDLQAKLGITKHAGGLKETIKLAELCHINKDSSVLDVGCGTGMTSCYIVKKYGCKVFGVDIRAKMIEKAKERAKRQGIANKIKFTAASIQSLPFKDNFFDAVISESVTAFAENKEKALSEYVRVTKKGGYIGFNETTWIKSPSEEIAEYVFNAIGHVVPEALDAWVELLESSGIKNILGVTDRFTLLGQSLNEIMMAGFSESVKAGGRFLSMCFNSPAYRKAIKEMTQNAWNIPRDFFKYFGYGIYVGRK